MSKTLLFTAWRYLIRHPWQTILMVLGITLGVAVVVAVDLANVSASRAFSLSTASITGKATHQVIAGPGGLNTEVYTQLRVGGFPAPSAPVITAYVTSPQLGERPMQLLGVDPFVEAPFRDYFGENASAPRASDAATLSAFITQPGALLVSSQLADRYGLHACDTPGEDPDCQITVLANGVTRTAFIAGLLEPTDSLSARALGGMLLADISTAQDLSGKGNTLDRIDLILTPENEAALLAIVEKHLPASARIQTVSEESGAVDEMTAAFRLNLSALSLLALLVGMFLIYNTITFSVVQRRPFYGTLRCLGVTRREVFSLVMVEAAGVGLLGAILGVALGVLMGQGAVRLVTQTINDLFFVLTVRGVGIPLGSLAKGALLGVIATLLTAAPPAYEAAIVPPRVALSRSGLESKTRRAIYLAAIFGGILILTGMAFLLIPRGSLTISFTGTFAIVVGFAMLVPLTTIVLMRQLPPFFGRPFGVLGRMAPRDVVNSLSRTSVAIMALMVAISVTIGVSLMVNSFRSTVITWLEETLQGDVYISAPGVTTTSPSIPLDPETLELTRRWPGVARVDVLQTTDVDSPNGKIHIAATDNRSTGQERKFFALDVDRELVWENMGNGAVLISEPLANRLELPRSGGEISLYTDSGQQVFPVVGIYYDYASTQGTVLMALDTYQKYWNDPAITAMALRLEPGVDPDQIAGDLEAALAKIQALQVRPNQALRKDVLEVFDRTFAITGALQLLATVVAFIGVLSALLSLELERQREVGILRSIGLTARQLFGLISLETSLMGAVAGFLSMPTGYVLALILVYIINRRSFGWTLQMQVEPAPFIQALILAVLAAFLAGVYPAIRMGRMVTSEALRAE